VLHSIQPPRTRPSLASALLVLLIVAIAQPAFGTPPLFLSGRIDGRTVEGIELIRATNRHIVLGTDGWLHDFDPQRIESGLESRTASFQPIDPISLRTQLRSEFGKQFEIVATNHFLVVQPRGQSRQWAEIFEQLHRTFLGYFTIRGAKVRDSSFPLVAIVFSSEAELQTHLRLLRIESRGVLGLYDRASNRIMLYDHGDSSGGVSATICHEAAHQSAFNTGVHHRLAETPRWIVEGVGCLFQSPAMIQGKRNAPLAQRIDQTLREQFLSRYQDRDALATAIEALLRNDRMFQEPQHVADAYALSWALTFYLSERRPEEFLSLIETYAKLPVMKPYLGDQRSQDIARILQTDAATLARQLQAFYTRN